ncbi:MAG: sensor histidine kinase [Paracoccaceae bacterium]
MPSAKREKPRNRNRILTSLPFRVVVFLALALLPIGLLAIWQTRDLADEASRRTSLDLLALTELAASEQRRLFERGLGAGDALDSILGLVNEDPTACNDFMTTYRERADLFSLVGFLAADGQMLCSSAGRAVDLSTNPELSELLADPRVAMIRVEEPVVSPTPVISLFDPVISDGVFLGFIILSTPQSELSAVEPPETSEFDYRALLTIEADGRILTGDNLPDFDPAMMPQAPIRDLLSDRRYTFESRSQDGNMRLYAMIPLLPEVAYAMTIWPRQTTMGTSPAQIVSSSIFPLLMWLASLFVAYFAVHRLVVGEVRSLSGQMRQFAANRSLPKRQRRSNSSIEFAELEETFVQMSYDLIEDEAKMEDALREKNVLLKEVHHRVKNNLQMISSIMNMQIRQSTNPKTRTILQRLQDRILGLATVHRYLYQADDLGKTDTGALLRDITQNQFQSLDGDESIRVTTDFEPIVMFPDQALPLALLVGEMTTNALKYVGAPAGEQAQIDISLRREESGQIKLKCENTRNPSDSSDDADQGGTGLGKQLIRAFSLQLGTTPKIEESDALFAVTVVFTVTEFQPAPLDY